MNWSDKIVLITGGAGSFGTAFSKYLSNTNIKKLIILSRDWLKHDTLHDELSKPEYFGNTVNERVRFFVGDVAEKDRLRRAFKDVDIVIHAAANKSLPSCEYNPDQCMRTNVIGTQNVIDACIEQKVNKCLFISTDKACNPINTYGTSKAMAEKLWLNANKYAASDDIRFSVCRYGNVCGSAGSVVPVWKKMIEAGATELPITHEDCTRFWFLMSDVMRFVDDSLSKMQGNEIFIPILPSIRITDLAAAFGLPYKVIGIREGEKIAETMGVYSEDGELQTSGNNSWFLSVDEIKETIK